MKVFSHHVHWNLLQRTLIDKARAKFSWHALDAKVRCLDVPLDQVLFRGVVAWHGAATLHGLPCTAPWCLTPIGPLFNVFEPLSRIILDGELDDLELDARWREIFTVGALVRAFPGPRPAR